MKKIFSLFLAVCVVMVLTCTAFASDNAYYYYNAEELPSIESVWDKSAFPYATIMDNRVTQVNGCPSLYLVVYNEPYTYGIDTSTNHFKITGSREWYVLENNKWVEREDEYPNNPFWAAGDALWTSVTLTHKTTGEIISASAPVFSRLAECDGSSCPATDVNIDGICDDCGMMLSLRSLTYPAFPSVDGSNKHYALVKTKYSGVDAYMYSVFTSDATYNIRGETPSTVYQIAVDGVADYIQYVTTDGQTWVEIQNSSVNNQSVGSGIVSQTTVIASTFDWYNEDGEHFFPVPLWVEVEEVTQGEMVTMGQTLGGMMKILVPCGVGCLALLMVLKLFGKRSLISRN